MERKLAPTIAKSAEKDDSFDSAHFGCLGEVAGAFGFTLGEALSPGHRVNEVIGDAAARERIPQRCKIEGIGMHGLQGRTKSCVHVVGIARTTANAVALVKEQPGEPSADISGHAGEKDSAEIRVISLGNRVRRRVYPYFATRAVSACR